MGCAIFDSILWYHRTTKVNPTFLSFVKLSGGVNLTPYVLVGWTLNMPTGADGITPACFLVQSKLGGASCVLIF